MMPPKKTKHCRLLIICAQSETHRVLLTFLPVGGDSEENPRQGSVEEKRLHRRRVSLLHDRSISTVGWLADNIV